MKPQYLATEGEEAVGGLVGFTKEALRRDSAHRTACAVASTSQQGSSPVSALDFVGTNAVLLDRLKAVYRGKGWQVTIPGEAESQNYISLTY